LKNVGFLVFKSLGFEGDGFVLIVLAYYVHRESEISKNREAELYFLNMVRTKKKMRTLKWSRIFIFCMIEASKLEQSVRGLYFLEGCIALSPFGQRGVMASQGLH
jgi:hypothetical protein